MASPKRSKPRPRKSFGGGTVVSSGPDRGEAVEGESCWWKETSPNQLYSKGYSKVCWLLRRFAFSNPESKH